jgi:hypothetical protein
MGIVGDAVAQTSDVPILMSPVYSIIGFHQPWIADNERIAHTTPGNDSKFISTEIDGSSYLDILRHGSDRKQFRFIVDYTIVDAVLFNGSTSAKCDIAIHVVCVIEGPQYIGHFSQNQIRVSLS